MTAHSRSPAASNRTEFLAPSSANKHAPKPAHNLTLRATHTQTHRAPARPTMFAKASSPAFKPTIGNELRSGDDIARGGRAREFTRWMAAQTAQADAV